LEHSRNLIENHTTDSDPEKLPICGDAVVDVGELVRLMERLQTRLEETPSPGEAVSKVIS
jgi:hypothetical protein